MSTEHDEESSFFMKLTVKSLMSGFPNVKNTTTPIVYKWLNGEDKSDPSIDTPPNEEDPGRVVVLDARPPEEYDVSHIAGAVRVDPNAELSDVKNIISLLQEYNGKQTVVSYCSLGYRSAKYAEALSKQFKKEHPDLEKSVKVYNLEGGLFKWANEGKPMVDHKNRPTVYAHPYNAVFGKLLHQNLRKQKPEP